MLDCETIDYIILHMAYWLLMMCGYNYHDVALLLLVVLLVGQPISILVWLNEILKHIDAPSFLILN